MVDSTHLLIHLRPGVLFQDRFRGPLLDAFPSTAGR